MSESFDQIRMETQTRPRTLQFPEPTMIVASQAMATVVAKLRKVAMVAYYPVLLTGETGVGKQETAMMLNETSEFVHRLCGGIPPFMEVDCASLTETLLETELFGHVEGAFTGAIRNKSGRLEMAQNGTLFLDEIGDASLKVQSRLLKFMDSGEITAVGDTKPKKVKTRVVAATNRDLMRRVEKKKFRDDLYHRLNVFPIHIPPLRERRDDIPPLATNCIRRFNASNGTKVSEVLTPTAMDKLLLYGWPGNIRQLFNVIERAIVELEGVGKIDGSTIVFDGTEPGVRQPKASVRGISIGGQHKLSEVEKAHIEGVLQVCKYNKQAAAAVLGLHRPTLYSKIKQHQITVPASARQAREQDEKTRIEDTLEENGYSLPDAANSLAITEDELVQKMSQFGIATDNESAEDEDNDEGGKLKNAAKAAAQDAERELIFASLHRNRWNRRVVAQELDVSYKTLLNKMKELDINLEK